MVVDIILSRIVKLNKKREIPRQRKTLKLSDELVLFAIVINHKYLLSK